MSIHMGYCHWVIKVQYIDSLDCVAHWLQLSKLTVIANLRWSCEQKALRHPYVEK